MSKDIKDAHSQEKYKKERKENKCPIAVLNHPRQ
jgi:hypothetical protein